MLVDVCNQNDGKSGPAPVGRGPKKLQSFIVARIEHQRRPGGSHKHMRSDDSGLDVLRRRLPRDGAEGAALVRLVRKTRDCGLDAASSEST